MAKRPVTAALWFVVGWTFGSMGTFFLGLPPSTDIALSLILGTLAWDPTGRLWARRPAGTRYERAEIQTRAPLATE